MDLSVGSLSSDSTDEKNKERGERRMKFFQDKLAKEKESIVSFVEFKVHALECRNLQFQHLRKKAALKHKKYLKYDIQLKLQCCVNKTQKQTQGSIWQKLPTSSLEHRSKKKKHLHLTPQQQPIWPKERGVLQWLMREKLFKQLKAYRPTIKVYVYAVFERKQQQTHEVFGSKEEDGLSMNLGWIFLDLRSPNVSSRWLKIQNSKFGGEIKLYCCSNIQPLPLEKSIVVRKKPVIEYQVSANNSHLEGEIKSIKVEIDPDRELQGQTKSKESHLIAQDFNSVENIDEKEEDMEFLRLGNHDGDIIYIVSISLEKAGNLSYVLNERLQYFEPTFRDPVNYWLSYSIFDVVIQTDAFCNLSEPMFSSIRDNFRIKSCFHDLKDFFLVKNPVLSIYLCTFNTILGRVEVPLMQLFDSENIVCTSSSNPNGSGKLSSFDHVEMSGSFIFFENKKSTVDLSIRIEQETKNLQSNRDTEETKENSSLLYRVPSSKQDSMDSNNTNIAKIVLNFRVLKLKQDGLVSLTAFEEGVHLSYRLYGQLNNESFSAKDMSCQLHASKNKEQYYTFENTSDNLYSEIEYDKELVQNLWLTIDCCSIESHSSIGSYNRKISSNVDINTLILLLQETSKSADKFKAFNSANLLSFALEDSLNDVVGDAVFELSIKEDEHQEKNDEKEADSSIKEKIIRPPNKTEEIFEEIVPELNFSDPNLSDSRKYRFRISIDLKSIKGMLEPANIYCSYYYPEFQTKKRVRTKSVSVDRRVEANIPQSFCQFSFILSPNELKSLVGNHISIDVVHRDRFNEEKIGTVTFSLNNIFSVHEKFLCCEHSSICQSTNTLFHTPDAIRNHLSKHLNSSTPACRSIRTFDAYHPILSMNTKHKKEDDLITVVGSLRVLVHLENLGRVDATKTDAISHKEESPEESKIEDLKSSHERGVGVPKVKIEEKRLEEMVLPEKIKSLSLENEEVPLNDHLALECKMLKSPDLEKNEPIPCPIEEDKESPYKPAYERICKEYNSLKQLQIVEQQQRNDYLEEQSRLLHEKVNRIELQRMTELEQEWSTREEERDAIVNSAVREYTKLETKLRESLSKVQADQAELSRQKQEHSQLVEFQEKQWAKTQQHLKQEQQMTSSMHKKQVKMYETRLRASEVEYEKLTTKLKLLEEEYSSYRAQQRQTSQAKLSHQIAQLQGQHMEMTSKYEEEKRQNQLIQDEKDKLLKQVYRLSHLLSQERQQKQQNILKEMEMMRLKYVAREECHILEGDRQELQQIQVQLGRLKDKQGSKQPVEEPAPASVAGIVQVEEDAAEKSPEADAIFSAELARLENEKKELLQSGVYTEQSSIIQELTRLIYIEQQTLQELHI